MADIPIITKIIDSKAGHNSRWPSLLTVECQTEGGNRMVFRLTGKAAHDLKPQLDRVANVGERPPLKSL